MSVPFTGPINVAQLHAQLGDLGGCVLQCSGGEWTDLTERQISCPSQTVSDEQLAAALEAVSYDPAFGLSPERALLIGLLEVGEGLLDGTIDPSTITQAQITQAVSALGLTLRTRL